MTEVDPDPHEPGRGRHGTSQLGGAEVPADGDPTQGGKRGEIGERPERDRGRAGRRFGLSRSAARRSVRLRALTRLRMHCVTSSTAAASVLAEAADARATVVLSGHVKPDADALGSTLALAEGLRRRGARVLTTFPDPFALPGVPRLAARRRGAGALVGGAVLPGRVRQPGRGVPRAAGGARRACSTTPVPRSWWTTTPATPASGTSAWSTRVRRPR